MKKRLQTILLVFSVAVLLWVVVYTQACQKKTLLGAQLATKNEIGNITKNSALSTQECALYWNGVKLPYNEQTNAYCLPQVLDGQAVGSLSAQWGSVYLPDWEWQTDWSNAIETGMTFPVYISDGTQWKCMYVYLSGMPAIAIDSQVRISTPRDMEVYGYTMGRLPVENNYGTIRVFWPQGNLRQQTVNTGVEWHWRGNASYFADKKSYRLNLIDDKGDADPNELLGLGEDSDWILLNLATDSTRVRDKVSNDLWNQMSEAYEFNLDGAECEYVELYLNDHYMGVYLLCTKIDQSSLGLTDQDNLYKLRQAAWLTDADFAQLDAEQSMEWLNKLEVVWPKRWSSGVWTALQNYLNLFYQRKGTLSWDKLEQTAQLDNLIDVALYKQFTCAIDNSFQNQYVLYNGKDGLCYRIPWDMNYTWGDAYEGIMEQDFTTLVIQDYELNALYQADAQRTKEKVAARWSELRNTLFDVDAILQAMQQETEYLVKSGAWGRDFALWGETGAYASGLSDYRTLNLEQTEELLKTRTEYLDEYMADYEPQEGEAVG